MKMEWGKNGYSRKLYQLSKDKNKPTLRSAWRWGWFGVREMGRKYYQIMSVNKQNNPTRAQIFMKLGWFWLGE